MTKPDINISEETEKKRRRKKNEGKNPKDSDKERDRESTAVGMVKKSTIADRNISEKVEKKHKRAKKMGKNSIDGEKEGDTESTAVEIVDKLTNADTNVSKKGVKKRKREKNKHKDLKVGEKEGDIESPAVEIIDKLTNADTNVSKGVKKCKREKNKHNDLKVGEKEGDIESPAIEIVDKLTNADTNVSKGVKKRKKDKNKHKHFKVGNKEGDIESPAVEIIDKLTNADTNVSMKGVKKRKREINKHTDFKVDKKEGDIESPVVEVTNADTKSVSKKGVKKPKREKNKHKDVKVGKKEGGIESSAVEDFEKVNADANVSEKVEKKKRKREKNKGKDLKDGEKEGDKMRNDEDTNAIESNSKDSKLKKKKKKVSFSDHDEVFPVEGDIVQGKRFTPEEDEIIKQAVFDYIDAHGLGEDGLDMVLHCISYPKLKHCWKEIGESLPHRPPVAVYDRAHSLFERDEIRKWSDDEIEIIKKFHAEHGPKWRQLADAMGKHRRHVKDAWRRTKLANRKRGHWSQEEYQNLFDLVNVDLRAKVNEEKKSKHGMLRDNICWSAISDKLASRTFVSCCLKWYDQLTSSMVKEGEWADTDDYHLIDTLYTLDACCIEDVDWDCLLEHRSGDVCRKRWKQMSNHIGEPGKKLSFVEQVEILSKRYCADMLEPRQIWDNKPRVP